LAEFHGEGLFYSFWREQLMKDWSGLLITDYTRVDALFSQFMGVSVDAVPEPVVGFDIKIDQLGCFPRLYGAIPQWGVKVIHLVRRNYLARVVSHEVMNRRVREGVRDLHREKQAYYRFEMDVDGTIEWMLSDEGANNYVQNVLGRHADKYLKVEYEALLEGRRDEVLASLLAFLGESPQSGLVADTIRQNDRALQSTLTNYDQFVSELRRRGLERFLGG